MILRRSVSCVVLLCAAALLSGCGSAYRAERAFWHANRDHGRTLRAPAKATQQEFDAAVAALRRIVKAYPRWQNTPNVQYALGNLYSLRGDRTAAAAEYAKVYMSFPDDAERGAAALFAIGELAERAGDWNAALAQYRQVWDRYPATMTGVQVPLYIARHYQLAKQPDQARAAYRQAINFYDGEIAKNPFDRRAPGLQSLLVIAYANQGDWAGALSALTRLAEKDPKSEGAPIALYRAAMILAGPLKQPDRAVEYFRRIVTQYPNSRIGKNAVLEVGNIAIMQGDVEKAQSEFDRMLDRYQDDASLCAVAQLALAAGYEKAGRWDDALQEYKKVRTQYPQTVEALRAPLLIAVHYRQKDQRDWEVVALKEAIQDYRSVVAGDGRNVLKAAALDLLSEAYGMLGQWHEAIGALQQLRERYPSDQRAELAIVRIGVFYQEGLKDVRAAAACYRQFLQEHPSHRLAGVVRDMLDKLQ